MDTITAPGISSDNFRIDLLTPQVVSAQLESLLPYFELIAQVSDGRVLTQDIIKFAQSGAFQVWVIGAGIAIYGVGLMEMVTYPRRTACRVCYIVGAEFDKWKHMLEQVEQFVHKHGNVTHMELLASPGFERSLAGMGYKKTHVLLEKRIG